MPAPLTPSDLEEALPTVSVARRQELIDDAYALACLEAPGIQAPGFTHAAALRAILRAAIVFSEENRSSLPTLEVAGPNTAGYARRPSSVLLSAEQVAQLRRLTQPAIQSFGMYSLQFDWGGRQ